MSKFKKNRSVDPYWYSVPTKYCLSVKGARTEPKYENIKVRSANDILCDTSFNDKIPSEVYDESRRIEKQVEDETGKWGWREGHQYIENWVERNLLKEVNKNRKKKFDKDFVIIQFYGRKKCLCAWRNSERCNIGIPFMCPIVTKNKKRYVKYKNHFIPLNDKSGWVI